MARYQSRRLERFQYWQGQMLRAEDFRRQLEVEAQERWWHNRAIHHAYGVASGLACTLTPAADSTGVLVTPGLAYDTFGRELILERPLTIPLPADVRDANSGSFTLVARYRASSPELRPDQAAEICWNAPGSVVPGTIEFLWATGSGVDPSAGVALIVIDATSGGLIADPSFQQIPVFPVAGPLLGSGATSPGSTPWRPWSFGFVPNSEGMEVPNMLGVQTWVDTSAAGFTRIPCYFATLQGPLWNPATSQLVPAGLVSLADESIVGFTFRIWLEVTQPPQIGLRRRNAQKPAGLRPAAAAAAQPQFKWVISPAAFLLYAQQQNLYVSWLGCQMASCLPSCPSPAPSTALGAASLASNIAVNLR